MKIDITILSGANIMVVFSTVQAWLNKFASLSFV